MVGLRILEKNTKEMAEMFEKQVKKLIIVTDEKNKPYANYLMALISAKDDKEGEIVGIADGSVEAVVWSEKNFADNEPTLSSSAHVLFLGDTKLSKSQRGGLNIKFDDFGLKYGWLGKRAVMYVDHVITSVVVYNRFYDYACKYQENFTKAIERKTVQMQIAGEIVDVDEKEYKKLHGKGAHVPVAAALAAFVAPITAPVATAAAAVVAPVAAAKGVANLKERKEVMQQQQSCLAMLFYMDGLMEFLEG